MSRLSGKFVVRVPTKLHGDLKDRALKESTSLNEVCVQLLSSNGSSSDPLTQILKSEFGSALRGLVLFGSQVRGSQTKTSDFDYLIVLSDKVPLTRPLYDRWDEITAKVVSLKNSSPHFTHLPRSTRDAKSLWCEVAIEGKVLWERNLEITRLLIELRHSIYRREKVRREAGGAPYWIDTLENPALDRDHEK